MSDIRARAQKSCTVCGSSFPRQRECSRDWSRRKFCSTECRNSRGPRSWTVDELFDLTSPEPNSGCWIWTASTDRKGYGQMNLAKKLIRVHRFSYELAKGTIPPGMAILHACDTPSCINPDHLSAGSQQANLRDMRKKGRQASHERHGFAKLTEAQVRAIRRSTEPTAVLARHHGVSASAISTIRNARKTWKGIE
jgi:hypothetical protein